MRVVQFGEGVFLRAFADWFFQRLNDERGTDIRVTLVQPRNSDGVARLMAQDGCYRIIEQGVVEGDRFSRTTIVDCIDEGINTHVDPDGFAARGRDPEVRVVVSNTTEAGISWNEDDAALGRASEAVRSFPGKLTWFLAERFRAVPEAERLFVLPCELIADNGQELQRLVVRMADAWGLGEEFERWLEDRVVFYDTLVDRIVPGRPTGTFALPSGEEDAFPVQAEWFHSWYLRGPSELFDVLPLDQDDFNVRLVDDLRPYRDLKVRVLNGLHTAMASVGTALGIELVREAVEDALLGGWLDALLEQEILPTLDAPADEVGEFARATKDRFLNPFVRHKLESILLNSSAKIPSRLGAVVLEREAKGLASPRIAFAVACWLHLVKERDLADDASVLERVNALWSEAGSPADVARRGLEVMDFAWPESFVEEVAGALERIVKVGPAAALREGASV